MRRYFFDECFSPRTAAAVAAVSDDEIRHHIDLFGREGAGLGDVLWIPQVAVLVPAFVVLTSDRRLLGRAEERRAMRISGRTYFLTAKGFATKHLNEQTARILELWRHIEKATAEAERAAPAIYRLPLHGRVIERLCATMDLRER